MTGGGAERERDQRGEELEPDVEQQPVHPFALSTSRTSNGCFPGGWISNESPQWPTMTSAGAECV